MTTPRPTLGQLEGVERLKLGALHEAGDAELVERVRAGDVRAYDLLVQRHMRRAFQVGYRILGDREDAEDLVEDAFLVALERLDGFDTERPFAPWLFRILVDRGLNARIPSGTARWHLHRARRVLREDLAADRDV